jgi:hypothetical protein
MPGMNSGPNIDNPVVVAAFRAALLHQGLIALLIFAVLAAAWAALRARRPTAGGSTADGSAAGRGTEPAGRQLLAIGFGNLWLFDGFLQAQPGMPLGLPAQGIEPTAAGSSPWVQHVVHWGLGPWSYHPVPAAAAAVWIQVGLGIWLLAAPRGTLSRLAGLASAGWGLIVWVFGESFGGIFAPGLSWLSGAPGAAAVYIVAGVLIALPERAWRSPRLGRLTLAGLGLFLAGMAVLQGWPGRGSWQGTIAHGQPGTLPAMTLSMSVTPQPGFLARWLAGFAALDEAHGFAVNLLVVAVLAVTAAAFLSGRPRLIRPVLAGFTAVCLAAWVLIQDLGFLGGVGTDPNSMIPLILLAGGGYLALTRSAAGPADQLADQRAGERAAGPATLRARAAAASTRSVVALGGAGLVVLGAVPMAVAQASAAAAAPVAATRAAAWRQPASPAGTRSSSRADRLATAAGSAAAHTAATVSRSSS